ncbi:hypothetical protein [Marinitenerispora sediminis]|uniref:Uncharacterized protein n=1 Tax=Marinitenerispora sediminis TaxID=1931232 RepID=A0A368T6K3_9ACTN|nr:hypothetical protein [Marinitenerispora sediminis]RCV50252.1 hypothetical protein DEF23_22395 [Marinitenerispora sediminis]RCV56315.1 hypothetical protein DEF24_16845 [Marinitenerispora sediminis]RCV56507.1 hypothetical protein DEF28_03295 [Marinitenerispora sediminis]
MRIIPRGRIAGIAAPALLSVTLLPSAAAAAEPDGGAGPDRPPTTAARGPDVHATGADPGGVTAYWTDERMDAAGPVPMTRG